MNYIQRMHQLLYWWLYPGVNLHARLRYWCIPSFLEAQAGSWSVLDAGCGNGMLSYQAHLQGGRVSGVSIKQAEVEKAQRLFNQYLGIPEEQLRFEVKNLYDLDYADEAFEAVICAEVLEHLKKDRDVCEAFYRILKPGGVVHICAPNAEHPYNKTFPLDPDEGGGHVRPGYTEESYRELLEPVGFKIESVTGLGGPIRQGFNRRIKEIQGRLGPAAGLPLFALALLALPFESRSGTERMPFSIYVKARKPRGVA